jgi:hypothetical protein
MDKKQILLSYVLVLCFAVQQILSFECNNKNLLTPNLTVNENEFLLVKNESYIDIKINQGLYLTCEGIEPIEWVFLYYRPVTNKRLFTNRIYSNIEEVLFELYSNIFFPKKAPKSFT